MSTKSYLYEGIQYPIISAGVFGANLFIGYDKLLAGTEGEAALGISLMASTAVGESIPVKVSGEAIVLSGSDVTTNNLAAGSPVTTNNAGKAILANADTDHVLGRVSPDEPTISTADTEVKIILCLEGRVASS